MKKYSYFIGIAIFICIIWRLDLKEFTGILSRANLSFIFLAFLLMFFSFLIKIYRWNYLKKIQGMIYSLKDSFLMNMATLSLGIITPGQIGEMSKFMYLKKDGHPIAKALINVTLDKFFDLFLLVVFGFLGLVFFFNFFQEIFWFFVLILIIIVIIIFSIKINWTRNLLIKIIALLIPKKYKDSFQSIPQTISGEIKKIKINNYILIILISGISWILFFAQAYLLTRSVGIVNIPFIYVALAATVARFVSALPISFIGLGTREGVFLLLFAPYNTSLELIVSFSIIVSILTLAVALIGLGFWFKKPVPIK